MKWDGKGCGDWCPRPLEEHRQKTFHSLCRLNHWLLSCGTLNRDSWEPSPHHHRVGFLQTHSLSSRPNHINKPNTHAEKKWQKRLRSIRTLPAERTAWEAGVWASGTRLIDWTAVSERRSTTAWTFRSYISERLEPELIWTVTRSWRSHRHSLLCWIPNYDLHGQNIIISSITVCLCFDVVI